jgi:putative addiction module component (TIGR02574 family)
MTGRGTQLLRDALFLPVDERADMAVQLLASLDDCASEDTAAVQAAWAREIEARARRVVAGESTAKPWNDVRAQVSRRLTER